MKTVFRRRHFFPLAAALLGLGLTAFHGAPVHAGTIPSGPIGDLTVTVQERADGGIDFSLSGSTDYKNDGSFSNTPVQYTPNRPPISGTAPGYEEIDLPAGLEFLLDGAPVPVQRLVFASGNWYLGVDHTTSSGNEEDSLSGEGTIGVPGVPYSHFVPGTFVVEGWLFDITYQVLPYSPPSNPRLQVSAAQRFPSTRERASSRAQRLRVASVGDAPVNRIRVRLSGAGARQFRVSQVASRSLAPGQRSTYAATFRPRTSGRHHAVARVTSNAPTVGTRLIGRARPQLPAAAPIR